MSMWISHHWELEAAGFGWRKKGEKSLPFQMLVEKR
jgi:hypothetical protein